MALKLFLPLALALFQWASLSTGAKNPNKFIDLTYAFNNQTMRFPGRDPSFYVEMEGYSPEGIWVASKGFCTSEHTATHIDAPYHFNKEGRKLHELPLEDMIDVPGVLIDIYDKVHKFKDGKLSVIQNYALTQEDVLEWENKHGKIPQGAVVLLRTGWASRWGNQTLYSGDTSEPVEGATTDDPNDKSISLDVSLNYPAYDVSAARFLAVERQVRGVGSDTLSQAKDFRCYLNLPISKYTFCRAFHVDYDGAFICLQK